MESRAETIWLQSILMYCARLDRSPELYCLKKSAGRERILIIVAACTDTSILVLIRASSRDFTDVKIRELIDTHTRNADIASNSLILPFVTMGEPVCKSSVADL